MALEKEFVNFEHSQKRLLQKNFLYPLIPCFFWLTAFSQISNTEISLLQKLDSIQHSSSISRHFGSLYFSTTLKAVEYFSERDPAEKALIERFETRFSGLFLDAAHAFQQGGPIPVAWRIYFSDTSFSPLAYKFFGLNAHINGDIWKAMTAEFSLEELIRLKKPYSGFQHSLEKQYVQFYKEACLSNKKLKRANFYTLGIGKLFGKLLLKKWRTRQYKLAMLYYNNPARFKALEKKAGQKKEHIDALIARHLTPGFVIFAASK
jgi:hypothetical protein